MHLLLESTIYKNAKGEIFTLNTNKTFNYYSSERVVIDTSTFYFNEIDEIALDDSTLLDIKMNNSQQIILNENKKYPFSKIKSTK